MDVYEKLAMIHELIKKNKEAENLYMKIYSFTTENIKGYIDYFDLKNKSLLTVGSSGDQILNAYYNGCRDITLIDINPYANYYVNLKIAGILSLDYEEFQRFFFRIINQKYNDDRYNLILFKKLSLNLKAIDYDSYYFFLNIFSFFNQDNNRLELIKKYLILDDGDDSSLTCKINNYLNDEKSYHLLKKYLKDICFNFINQDIFNFNSSLKFDNIFLSNICTTVGILKLKSLLLNLRDNNLNNKGSMLMAYLWNINYDSQEEGFDWKEIYRMPATRVFLKELISEHYNICGISDILFNTGRTSDLVLIHRKN